MGEWGDEVEIIYRSMKVLVAGYAGRCRRWIARCDMGCKREIKNMTVSGLAVCRFVWCAYQSEHGGGFRDTIIGKEPIHCGEFRGMHRHGTAQHVHTTSAN